MFYSPRFVVSTLLSSDIFDHSISFQFKEIHRTLPRCQHGGYVLGWKQGIVELPWTERRGWPNCLKNTAYLKARWSVQDALCAFDKVRDANITCLNFEHIGIHTMKYIMLFPVVSGKGKKSDPEKSSGPFIQSEMLLPKVSCWSSALCLLIASKILWPTKTPWGDWESCPNKGTKFIKNIDIKPKSCGYGDDSNDLMANQCENSVPKLQGGFQGVQAQTIKIEKTWNYISWSWWILPFFGGRWEWECTMDIVPMSEWHEEFIVRILKSSFIDPKRHHIKIGSRCLTSQWKYRKGPKTLTSLGIVVPECCKDWNCDATLTILYHPLIKIYLSTLYLYR